MQLLRLLAYAALTAPLLVGAFVGGIVFERHRPQTASIQTVPAPSPPVAAPAGDPPKAQELPKEIAPPQTAAAAPLQQEAAPPPKERSPREQKIEEAMQAIQAAWQVAIDNEQLLAVKTGTCYGGRFIRRGADLQGEVENADTSTKWVIRIRGMAAVNQPAGKQSCSKSITEALAASRAKSESLGPVDATFTYKVGDGEIRLDHVDSDPGWLVTALTDSVRLNLQSWTTVAMQPIK
jgi:pyruvate/2-oxoglutarate dehydrogenase complex dihydrolipoamide acyltransferase (E2) component